MCVLVCVCVCVRACVRACVHVCGVLCHWYSSFLEDLLCRLMEALHIVAVNTISIDWATVK